MKIYFISILIGIAYITGGTSDVVAQTEKLTGAYYKVMYILAVAACPPAL